MFTTLRFFSCSVKYSDGHQHSAGPARFKRRTASALLYDRFVLVPRHKIFFFTILMFREQPRILINDCLVHSGGRAGQAKRSLEEMDTVERMERGVEDCFQVRQGYHLDHALQCIVT